MTFIEVVDALTLPFRFVARVALELFAPVFNRRFIEETPEVVRRVVRHAIQVAIEKHGLNYSRAQFSEVVDQELAALKSQDRRLLEVLPLLLGFEVRDAIWKDEFDAALLSECRARGLIDE